MMCISASANMYLPTMFSTEWRLDSHSNTVIPYCILSNKFKNERGWSHGGSLAMQVWLLHLLGSFLFKRAKAQKWTVQGLTITQTFFIASVHRTNP
jgi:hypothetical protein